MPEVRNFDDYVTKAKQMWTRNTSSTLVEAREGSDFIRFDHETGVFSVMSENGNIRSMYRLDEGFGGFLEKIE